jgi:hypothetical protein
MNTTFETRNDSPRNMEWLTPPYIIKALGSFDLDPCSPMNRPWDTAKEHYNKSQNGLLKAWRGRVWCNPPYGKETSLWLEKCSLHKDAIALIFARTDTKMFFQYVWSTAKAILFIKGRVKFHKADGTEGGTSGAPSVLIAFNNNNALVLKDSAIEGKFLWI